MMGCAAHGRNSSNSSRGGKPAAMLLLLVAISLSVAVTSVAAHADHSGCGQHSPLAMQQQRILHRRLQELRQQDKDAAAAAAAKPGQQQGTGNSKPSGNSNSGGSSSSGGGVAPRELRIGAVYNLAGVGGREAGRIEKQLVPAAIKVLQKYLKVLRVPGAPIVPMAFYADSAQGGCVISKASPALAQAAKQYDLSMYITAAATGCLPGMIAVATACEVDPATKRPILGTLNICPASLAGLDSLPQDSESYGFAIGRLVEVLVHETTHVLGFGSNHYEDWRGPDGKPYGKDRVVVSQGGRPFLATPRVTKVAREFFSCPGLPGAPLENEGPSFSALSHFEYRMLQRELMSPARPIDRSRARLSAFTLAALEDSGWYAADYSDAEPLDWGRGAGCDFVLASCWEFIDKVPDQPYFCGKGSVNQTRCTAAASGWGVCRSSGFTDGCLLVGKYAPDASAAVKDDVAPSGADGRTAACYSPPQLQALQAAGNKGNLLPLLGGSFSAQPDDICYNLVSQQQQQRPGGGSSGGSNSGSRPPGCVVPEDCQPGGPSYKGAQQQQQQGGGGGSGAAKQGAVAAEAGASSGGRRPLASLEGQEKAPAVLTFFEHDAKQGGVREIASSGGDDRTAACVSVAEGLAGASSSSSSSGTKPKRARALLSLLSSAVSHVSSPFASSSSSRSLLAASGAAFTAVVQAPAAASATAAACTSSPVLCFRSSCNAQGQLFVEAQLPASSSSSSGSSSTVRFACPSGRTVDLSKALPGRYLLGLLQCPSNQLVCETTGCGECSPSGGSCSRGRCHCHMERFGPGCKQSIVPRL